MTQQRGPVFGRPPRNMPNRLLRAFELTASLTEGGSATADELVWSNTSEDYTAGDEFTVDDTLSDSTSSGVVAASGKRGFAQRRAGSSATAVWEVVSWELDPPTASVIWCQVDEGSGVGSGAASFTVDTVSVVQPEGAATPSVTTVYNVLGFTMADDAVVYAVYNTDTNHWEALHTEPTATAILCLTDGAVASTDSTFSVNGVSVVQPSGAATPSVSELINTFGHVFDDNATVYAVLGPAGWLAIQGDCPT